MANTMELEMNGTVYAFKAGFAFIREVDPLHKQKRNGIEENVGLNVLLGGLLDKNADDLLTALIAMNKGQEQRVTKKELEEYIEEHDDIESLYGQVIDFLSNANCTKAKMLQLTELYQEMQKKQRADLLGHGANSTSNV